MPRAAATHTYDESCICYVPDTPSSLRNESDQLPLLRAQYFYLASFDIDDVFTPQPPVQAQSSQDGRRVTVVATLPPQPFSAHDNAALDKAWYDMRLRRQEKSQRGGAGGGATACSPAQTTKPIQIALTSHQQGPSTTTLPTAGCYPRSTSAGSRQTSSSGPSGPLRAQSDIAGLDVPLGGASDQNRAKQHPAPPSRIPRSTSLLSTPSPVTSHRKRDPPSQMPAKTSARSPHQLATSQDACSRLPVSPSSPSPTPSSYATLGTGSLPSAVIPSSTSSAWTSGSRHRNGSTSGSPFARAPIRNKKFLVPDSRYSEGDCGSEHDSLDHHHASGQPDPIGLEGMAHARKDLNHANDSRQFSEMTSHPPRQHSASAPALARMKESQALLQPLPTISVTVGYSRLYTVRFPSLILHPVYWAPIGDVAPVIRGTWFYKSTMLPVEPEVANRLERGYCYMRPWTGTWQDELNSCVEHGAEAEEKIVWKLFQQEQEEQGGDTAPRNTQDDAEQFEKGAHDGANHALQFDQTEAAGPHGKARDALRPTSVIYVNATDAQILRPSLLPSAHRGRRPLSAIRKGHEIGIAVVRGFDYKRWSKLHPPRTKTAAAGKLMEMYSRGRASGQVIAQPRCPGCLMEERKPRPTELVLVIHGIGQKLSERVESFNFTHHINGFRRQVNIEMSETSIWPSMRDGMGGLMVLPVNWRAILSREDDDVHALTHDDPNGNQFTLKDITPETVPYVRNMISDVMLDIPYYLSNHKPKMIAAVAKEANRVYRLWCANNPGFQEYGRVHIIAHSLGSVMAVDILSRQPTALLPRPADVTATSLADRSSDQLFNFDTKNLFLCGSPVGFFLLLNKATLSPRQGRTKPGLREGDMESGLCGERGQYGCLAVDNVYNIMHDTDPISYCLNAAVDRRLAAVLKPAFLPSLQTSWMQSLSHVLTFSSSTPLGGSQSANGSSTVAEHVTLSKSAAAPLSRHLPPTSPSGVRSFTPATPLHPLCSPVSAMSFDADQDNPADPDTENPLTQLPSNVELETHDFTREEIAEKRMYALNDNGQIDYHMSGNAGPLSIQYLNMLSAHTSYWSSQDFTRLVVMEVGREPGRKHAIAALKARKKKGWQGGKNEAK